LKLRIMARLVEAGRDRGEKESESYRLARLAFQKKGVCLNPCRWRD